MSLAEVYELAHTAECRLNMSATQPDRNLRFVVGHLMHYESLRLRIVEIEHDIGKAQRAQRRLQDAANGQLTLMQQPDDQDPEVTFEEEDLYDDADVNDNGDLGLTRFPSGSARPPPLIPDEGDTEEDDEREEDFTTTVPSEELDEAVMCQALKRPADAELTEQMERVRRCPCHGHTDAPKIEHVWTLPHTPRDKPGFTHAIAQEAA